MVEPETTAVAVVVAVAPALVRTLASSQIDLGVTHQKALLASDGPSVLVESQDHYSPAASAVACLLLAAAVVAVVVGLLMFAGVVPRYAALLAALALSPNHSPLGLSRPLTLRQKMEWFLQGEEGNA